MIETEDIRLSQERLSALKELITPIKDLAKNWDVDIHSELEKYMSSFSNDTSSDNFAEAALVIQGTAGVWGKKVEFLYSLVVDSLGMLEDKRQKSKSDKNDSDSAQDDNDTEMMTLPPVSIKTSNNLSIDLGNITRTEHFKPRIPLCLSSLSIKNNNEENLLYNRRGEVLASRDDFTINTCLVHKTGFSALDIQSLYLLSETSKNAMTPFFRRFISKFDGYTQKPYSNLAKAVESDAPDNPEADEITENNEFGDDPPEPPGALDLSDEDVPDLPPTENDPLPPSPKTPLTRSSTRLQLSRDSLNISQDAPVIHKLEQHLDSHTPSKDKPFKKANIEKPKINRKRKKSGPPKTPLSEVLKSNKCVQSKVKFMDILRRPIYPESTQLFKKMQSKEKLQNTNLKKKLVAKSLKIEIPKDIFKPVQMNLPNDNDDDNEDLPADFDDDDADVGTFVACPEVGDFKIDDANHSMMEHLENTQREALKDHHVTLTYEDLVKKHVEQFTTEAKQHYKVSELRERVIQWDNMISPILEEEEKQTPYDVCHYSNKLITKLSDCDHQEANFSALVRGETKSEVCRLFLTSLMLTNSENICLQALDTDARCKLVSTQLFSDVLEGYVAPSSDGIPNTKNKGKKRKNNEVPFS